jgi:hypothetical protein
MAQAKPYNQQFNAKHIPYFPLSFNFEDVEIS